MRPVFEACVNKGGDNRQREVSESLRDNESDRWQVTK